MIDTVSSITPHGPCRVYDLTVKDSHRFGANGILVHNCATPEESFQHTTASIFSYEIINDLRLNAKLPAGVYEFVPGPYDKERVN